MADPGVSYRLGVGHPERRAVSLACGGTIGAGFNEAGLNVGSYRAACGSAQGFLYSGGTYTTLDDPSATNGTFANGINDRGQIVGSYVHSADNLRGFLYSGGFFTTIDDPLATNGTMVQGINDAGQIVGIYIDASGPHIHATAATVLLVRVPARPQDSPRLGVEITGTTALGSPFRRDDVLAVIGGRWVVTAEHAPV